MTCVVGVRSSSGVLLAADSQWSEVNISKNARDAKVVNLSDLVAIGYCGSGRLGQILTYHMEMDDPPLGADEHAWAVRTFVDALRCTLEEYGHLRIESDGERANLESMGDSRFLLAVRGRLFSVYEDFEVLEHEHVFDTVGSGEEVAFGAMRAMLPEGTDLTVPFTDALAEKVATAGLKAAIEITHFVGGKIRSAPTVCWTHDELELAKKILGR